MFAAKINVKCGELTHQSTFWRTIPQIFDCFDGWKEIRSRRMQRYANWCIPPAKDIISHRIDFMYFQRA